MAEPAAALRVPAVGSYELWMLAHGAMGFVGVGGMMFLIPAYVLEQGGSPADAGAVMALAGALALTAPLIGGFADRFEIHRAVQVASLGLLAASAVSFAFATQELLWLVAATLLGLGMAGLTVVNATFVVGAHFDDETQARKLSLLQLSLPSGQVLGLAAVAALAAAAIPISGRFLVLAGAAVAFLLIVFVVNRAAAARIGGGRARSRPGDDAHRRTVTLRTMLLSQFGVTMLIIALITMSSQAIESQYPNYMQDVFGIDQQLSASALSMIVLVSIPLYLVAGRWTAASGPRTPFLVSAAARAAAGAGLLILPPEASGAALLAFGVIMVVYPLFELNAATLAALTSPIGPGGGQGVMGAAMALGTIIASVAAGWFAGQFGFASLAGITLAASGTALLVGIVALRRQGPMASAGRRRAAQH